MTFEWNDLRELTQYDSSGGPVVSLFLNLGDPSQIDTQLNSLIRTAHKQVRNDGNLESEWRRPLEGLLSQLESRVRSQIAPGMTGKLLVVYADTQGLWHEFRFPVGLPSRLVIRRTPLTRPLSLLLDEFPEYRVLVLDAHKARLFTLYLGEFKENPDFALQDEVPDRVSVKKSMTVSAWGVYSGVGDRNIQQHIKDHMHRHFKRVAEQIFDSFKIDEFDRLILAAPDERTVSLLKDHLHGYLRDRVVGVFQARPDDEDTELKTKSLGTAGNIEQEEQQRMLDRLVDLHLSDGLGVLGLESVLGALRMGQIHTLVIKDDFAASGYVCPEDRFLSAGEAHCPMCGEELRAVDGLPEEIVQEAIAQSSEVRHVTVPHAGFDPHGIGAFLRFRM